MLRLDGGGEGGHLSELASGVDALYLSGRAQLPGWFVASLGEARERAGSGSRPQVVVLGTEAFTVGAAAMGRYRYRLDHEHGPIGVTESEALPAFRIQPRSEFLHAVGPAAAVEWYRTILRSVANPVVLTVSRIDLHSDWQGWSLDGDDRRRFLCRATRRDTYERAEEFSGFVFGSRKTKTVSCRIYDKTREVEEKGHDWWIEKWGDRFDANERVLRVEFEFGREGLKSFQVNRPEEALEAVGDLWRYASEDWLTYRDPSDDRTPSRWPVAAEWRDIQAASLRSEAVGLARIREGTQRASLRKLLPGLNGYLVGLAAHVGTTSVEDTLAAAVPYLKQYELTSGRSFADRVEERKGAA